MSPNLPAASLNNLLGYVKAGLSEVLSLIPLITILDAIGVVEQVSLACISDLHLQCLTLEVVRRQDLNMTTVCVFKRIFQKIDQDLFKSYWITLKACRKLAVLPL